MQMGTYEDSGGSGSDNKPVVPGVMKRMFKRKNFKETEAKEVLTKSPSKVPSRVPPNHSKVPSKSSRKNPKKRRSKDIGHCPGASRGGGGREKKRRRLNRKDSSSKRGKSKRSSRRKRHRNNEQVVHSESSTESSEGTGGTAQQEMEQQSHSDDEDINVIDGDKTQHDANRLNLGNQSQSTLDAELLFNNLLQEGSRMEMENKDEDSSS